MDYKGWAFTISGNSCSDYFDVDIFPEPLLVMDIARELANKSYQKQCKEQVDSYKGHSGFMLGIMSMYDKRFDKTIEDFRNEWLNKMMETKFNIRLNNPSRLFSQYSQREKEVEYKIKSYIDTNLKDYLTWLNNNSSKILK